MFLIGGMVLCRFILGIFSPPNESAYKRTLDLIFGDTRLIHRSRVLLGTPSASWGTKTDVFLFCFNYTADIISTVEFNHSGELLATGDKGGRVVIFQQEQEVSGESSLSPFQLDLETEVCVVEIPQGSDT